MKAGISMKTFLFVMGATPVLGLADAKNSEQWGTEPLGPAIEIPADSESGKVKRTTAKFLQQTIQNGEPWLASHEDFGRILIVVGDNNPNNAAFYGAKFLQEHLQKISGLEIPLTSENKVARKEGLSNSPQFTAPDGKDYDRVIWMGGGSEAALAQGVHSEDLPPGGYRMETTEDGLIIAGNDVGDTGSQYAVNSLLERMGVRWLWPGELGLVLPKLEDFSLPRFSESDQPALTSRAMRFMVIVPKRSDWGLALLGEDEKTYVAKYEGVRQWSAAQRLGGKRMSGGHVFGGWYEKYGEEHPDWFALQPDGTRIQIGGRERLCVSNLELAKEAAKNRLEFAEENPDKLIGLGPNDGGSTNFFCMCPACRALDPSNAPPIELLFSKNPDRRRGFMQPYVSLTDRFVTFFNRVAGEVLKIKPDAKFTTYAYSAYRDAPLDAPLDPAFTVGFVGLTYYDKALRQEDLNRWNRWTHKASSLYIRPNVLLGGRFFPTNYSKELGEDLNHCYQTGMMGADFDGATHDWATRGLVYYVLARLLWNPSQSVEPIVEDYCRKGFRPAAEPIKAYFEAIGDATRKAAQIVGELNSKETVREEEVGVPVMSAREKLHRAQLEVFNESFLAELERYLSEARKAAANDQTILDRIDFLAVAKEYAYFQTKTYAAEYQGDDLKAAMQDLLDFMKKVSAEQPLAMNTAYFLWDQESRFRILQK